MHKKSIIKLTVIGLMAASSHTFATPSTPDPETPPQERKSPALPAPATAEKPESPQRVMEAIKRPEATQPAIKVPKESSASNSTDTPTKIDLSTPEKTAHAMMEAMTRGDAASLQKIFVDNAQLRRINEDKTVSPNEFRKWKAWVGDQTPGDVVEDIFDIKVLSYGDLASVWAPFIVSYQGSIVGCGVNQLSMVHIGNVWKIVSGIDIQAKANCHTFKETYSEKQETTAE